MEKIYGMQKLVGLQFFWSGTPTFSSGTPTFCQMGVLNSCFKNPSESSAQSFSYNVMQITLGSFSTFSSVSHDLNIDFCLFDNGLKQLYK